MQHRALVGLNGFQSDVLQTDVPGMTDGEALCRLYAVSRGLGVVGLAGLSRLAGLGSEERIAAALLLDIFQCETATKLDIEIPDAHIADGTALYASGTVYKQQGKPLQQSLGLFEHWNKDHQYTKIDLRYKKL